MQLTNVSNGTPAKEATKSDLFEGHYVSDGKVVRTWGEWFTRTDLSSLQKKYDDAHPNSAGGEEVAFYKKPFVFIGNMVRNIAEVIQNAFKACFFCFFKAEETPEEGKKEAAKPAS